MVLNRGSLLTLCDGVSHIDTIQISEAGAKAATGEALGQVDSRLRLANGEKSAQKRPGATRTNKHPGW